MLLEVANRSGLRILMSRKLAGAMPLLQIEVRLCATGHAVAVVVRELLDHFGRGAEYETAWRDDRAFGDDSAGAYNASFADHCLIEHDRADAN